MKPEIRNPKIKICVIGCGAIGSLYAAHLTRLPEVELFVFVRRADHAAALNQDGLRVSGKHGFQVAIHALSDASDLPPCDFGIIATKATQTETAFAPIAGKFNRGAVLSAQNGLGGEEILAKHARGHIIRGTTFMSGTRHSDTHVQYELEAPTWLGPFEPTNTPFAAVEQLAALINRSGLKAEALPDARPAQWSKLIFNASVNSVAAISELPHCRAFADESRPESLGHLLRGLINEGVAIARALGINLREDPWEMNKIGAQTDHPPSMLYDIQHRRPTEIDYLCGAIARQAARAGVPAPLHTAMHALVKGKEAAWNEEAEGGTQAATVEK